jgi:aldose 1-epimerase
MLYKRVVCFVWIFLCITPFASAQQWSKEKANQWYATQPWIVGCNFIPSSAINPLEMWQAETFDSVTIDRELGWAADIGMNTCRVFLHDLAYKADPDGFKYRINCYLRIAQKHGIKTSFVFFDDCWNRNPKSGPQPQPTPGVHNSGWVQSPGADIVMDSKNRTEWNRLEVYVKDILTTFKNDERVLYWDLYNEPGNGIANQKVKPRFLNRKSLPLLKETFRWAREVNPIQPLTSGTWIFFTAIKNFQLKNSDIITFHNYFDANLLSAQINTLQKRLRPLICTEWMARKMNSKVQSCLPVFKAKHVGCLNWGFVSGKTQTIYPWNSKPGTAPPKLWFHDLLYPDGTPYNTEEINTFKRLTANPEMKTTLNPDNFEKLIDGKQVHLFSLANRNGLLATITNYGGKVVSLETPDKQGNLADIVMGFSSIDNYLKAKEPYFGALIGRYGNRIANGKFTLNGKVYTLATNNGVNHLHGGGKGFNAVVWDAKQINAKTLELSYLSVDGEEGYPGNLNVQVIYTLTDSNELKVEYSATTDQPTVVNLTHHSFFNLCGEGNGTINDHVLHINADAYTPVDAGLIPTGNVEPVDGTPFDFRSPKAIKTDLQKENEQLGYGHGYDHNFVLKNTLKNAEGLSFAAKVTEPMSGRTMEVWTNEPGLQFYGGNFLNGSDIGKCGKPYSFRTAFCLETQHFPDSPNQPNFSSTVLKPGTTYHSVCVYKFEVE